LADRFEHFLCVHSHRGHDLEPSREFGGLIRRIIAARAIDELGDLSSVERLDERHQTRRRAFMAHPLEKTP
jgi:hypothetical protein